MSRSATYLTVALVASLAGCNADPSAQPPKAAKPAKVGKIGKPTEAPEDGKLAEVAEDGKDGKVVKERKGPKEAQPAAPDKAETPTLTAQGGFETSKRKALDSAILVAADLLHDHFESLNPPAHRRPTTELIWKMLIRHPELFVDGKVVPPTESQADLPWEARDKVKVIDELISTKDGTTEKMYRVEVALKVKPEHVRTLRSRERSAEVLWGLGGAAALALVVAVFFRIDSWTKGYLTSWLVLGTVGSASLLAGLWWWAR